MYSVKSIKEELQNTLHQYLEADYHIWDESLIIARQALLGSKNITSSDPRLEASPTYKAGVPFSKMAIPKVASDFLTKLSKISGAGVYAEPRAHQKDALEKFLGEDREIIVATGTGSGKTECFLYPILGGLAIEGTRSASSVKMKGCRVLLLYPMNALVNDQLTRLRKMFGNEEVSELIQNERGRRATFGVYTSKTDYPGARVADRDKKLLAKIRALYSGDALKKMRDLWSEGLWPAKDMQSYIETNLQTSSNDAELFSRHEIQLTPPDILVTNYSMLEYMLARPIERDIFDGTSEWLHADPANYLTIVLDEAHMYKGVAGAEVALLLRRLQSRLRVDRSKIKFILTSASLGNEESDRIGVVKFAKELTGKPDGSNPFELVTSIIESKSNEALPTPMQINALALFDTTKLHAVAESLENAVEEVNSLFEKLGVGAFNIYPNSIVDFKDEIYKKLNIFPPAALLANKLTSKPTSYDDLISKLFRDKLPSNALEALLALCTFAQLKETQQVFLPIRLHLMYRGIPGLYACINPNCSDRHDTSKPSLLGKLFTHPALSCGCGGRVFEVLTHRDCGAAYIRGFVSSDSPEFLLHQQAIGSSTDKLIETHFLIESSRSRSSKFSHNWVHIFSGKILKTNPNSDEFIQVCVSDDREVSINGKSLWTFPKSCPVCSRRWQDGTTKIQDLGTKGEAPFSYLVRSQVIDQPASKKADKRTPLGGRKTLVFSDGRQKAARLARDIPRNVEKDVFRICLVLAINYLDKNHGSPTLKQDMVYLAFLIVISEKNILLFDGDGRDQLMADLRRVEEYLQDDEDLHVMLEDNWSSPPQFSQMLLVNLGSQYYSLAALTIASIYPSKRALKSFIELVKQWGLTESDALEISVNWLNRAIESKFAFDKDLSLGVRRSAIGYDKGNSSFGIDIGDFKSFYSDIPFLEKSNRDALEKALLTTFCEVVRDKYFVNPTKVRIQLNLDGLWHQCTACTKLSIELIRGNCPHCGGIVQPLNPNDSTYLRARKGFYRDPVINALKDGSHIYNLCVEEHTAQLSYRDEEDHVSTNESYERRFKDILVEENDSPVDILSCTTTMEVGVDIGSLIAVSMRNVPPARQNYQQRAGRAGRRGSAVSTVLTFAQTGSHDSYFFEHPDEIISGNPRPPEIDINNEKVIKRHVIAAIIQSYFHRMKIDKTTKNNDLLSVLGLTNSFYGDDPSENFTFSSMQRWLSAEFEGSGIRSEIAAWIPGDFSKLSIDDIKQHLLSELSVNKPKDLSDKGSYEEKFLNFLFTLDLLPSYAFPRHVCAFQIERRIDTYKRIETVESPQQNLSTALTEYAVGRLVVVNKKTYKVGTIAAKTPNTEKDRASPLFAKKRQYLQCSNCLFTEIFNENSPNRYNCTHCGSDEMEVLDVIQPEVVYPSGRDYINEFDDDDLYTSATAAQLPFMGESTDQNWSNFKHASQIISQENQLLVTINKGEESSTGQSGFWVCSSCGKATAEKEKPQGPHERDYFVFQQSENTKCSGTYERVNTGYSFNSDVFILRLPLDFPMMQMGPSIDKDGLITAARTLSEAILKEASIQLEIDPSEMNCGIRFLKINKINYLDIFIYDTASGGAGYANMTGLFFGSIFSGVAKLLRRNDCCNTSCYRCLQHYGNRWHHNNLDKKYGLMLWRKINDDVLPNLYTSSEQMVLSSSLQKLMALEGWTINQNGDDGLLAQNGEKKISLVIYPVLLDQRFVKNEIEKIDVCISDFEIEKSLPSAYLKITSA